MEKYNPRANNNYLNFEKENFDYMDADSISINRRKYNFSELELANFYKEDYKNYKVFTSKKGQAYKFRCKETKIENKPKKIEDKPKKFEKFNDEEVKEQLELFNKLFSIEDNVFIRLLCRKTGEYYNYPVAALKDFQSLKNILNSHRFTGKEDLMYTFNTYNTLKKAEDKDLHLITAISIDVDFGEVKKFKNKKPIDIINLLEKIEFDKTIPTPQIVEFGHNLRLIYALEKIPATKASKRLAIRLATIIGERLVDYKGSKQPLTTYGRVINSINSKDNSKIKVMYFHKERYKLKDLQAKWLEPLPEWYPEWKAKTNRKVISFTKDFQTQAKLKVYNENRITDCYKIQDFFKEDDCDGFRRFLCFQVRNHAILAGMSSEEAEKVLEDFNSKFRKPLNFRLIERDTRNVERKQYKYKSQTILDYIGLNQDDEILLNLSAILSVKEIARRNNNYNKAKQRAKYRNVDGLTKTEVKRLEEFIKIAKLELQGYSIRTIAKELEKSPSTLSEKINKTYDKINYKEILEEVKQGVYHEIRVLG